MALFVTKQCTLMALQLYGSVNTVVLTVCSEFSLHHFPKKVSSKQKTLFLYKQSEGQWKSSETLQCIQNSIIFLSFQIMKHLHLKKQDQLFLIRHLLQVLSDCSCSQKKTESSVLSTMLMICVKPITSQPLGSRIIMNNV